MKVLKVVFNVFLAFIYLTVIVFGYIFVKSLIKDNKSVEDVVSNFNITQSLYEEMLYRKAEINEFTPTVPFTFEYESKKGETVIQEIIDSADDIYKIDESDYNKTLDPDTINKIREENENTDKTGTENPPSNLKCSTTKYTQTINNNGINRIHYISVGGGDATLIESNGHFGLVDATNPSHNDGTTQSFIDVRKYTVDHVIDYLKKLIGCSGQNCKGKLEFVVGTHAHSDHIGGMVKIAQVFGNANTTYYYRAYKLTGNDFFENGVYNSSLPGGKYDEKNNRDNMGYYSRTYDAMVANKVCLEEVTNKNIEFNFGEFNIKLLNTTPASDDESICIKDKMPISSVGQLSKTQCEAKGGKLYAYGENKNSIIQLVTYKNTKALLAADIEKEDELRLLKDSKTKSLLSNIDTVKLAHHGANTSNHIDLVKVMKPKNAINSRETFYAPAMALLQQKYMQKHYNTNIYLLGGVDDAIVQTFAKDGVSTLSNSDKTKKLDKALDKLEPVSTSNNWYQYNLSGVKHWFYFDNEEVVKTMGWFKYNNKWYYLSNNGYAVTGWQYLSYNGKNSWYYFDNNGVMQTGWLKSNNKWYYLSSSGTMVTGWQKINYKGADAWFYFDDNGVMLTGWQQLPYEGKKSWFYLDDNGVMLTGWQKLKYNGVDNWYYFNSGGAMQTGWQKIKYNGVDNWYYFNNSGAMVTGFVYENGKTYYLKSDGVMAHDTCLTIEGKNYCFNSSGEKTN